MRRRARMVGTILAAVGLAVMIGFGGVALWWAAPSNGELRKAQLLRERNPGNQLYDLQFFIALVKMGFLVVISMGGGLLALNGVSLILLDDVTQNRRVSGRRGSS